MREGGEIGTLVEITLHHNRLSIPFQPDEFKRNGCAEVPGKQSFKLIERAAAARGVSTHAGKVFVAEILAVVTVHAAGRMDGSYAVKLEIEVRDIALRRHEKFDTRILMNRRIVLIIHGPEIVAADKEIDN